MEKQSVIAIVKCCREWPVYVYFQGQGPYTWHRCGLCGTKPTFDRWEGEPPWTLKG